MSASRVQRWAIILMNYNFKIKHIPGKNNCTADCLSRLLSAQKLNETDDQYDNDYNHLNFISENINVISATEVEKETDKDKVLKDVKKFIIQGWPKEISDDLKIYIQKAQELTIENGCIMWGYRLVIPFALREYLLKELHQAHMGIVRMKMLARSYIWWPGIDKEIESITKKCELCLKNASNPPKSYLHVWAWPEKPNERIHIDFLGPINNSMYVAIIDAHSKWADIREMSKITAEATIDVLKQYICTWGLPLLIVSDNGPAFIAEKFAKFCEKNGIKHVKSPTYHPASNGAAENLVKTFKRKFKIYLQQGINKTEALLKFLFYYRSLPHCTTGVSPAELQMGYKFRTSFDLLKIKIRENVSKKQLEQKEHYNGNRQIEFALNQNVMAKDYCNNAWVKAIIISKLSPVTYNVLTENNLLWKRHINQLTSQELDSCNKVITNEKDPSSSQIFENNNFPNFNVNSDITNSNDIMHENTENNKTSADLQPVPEERLDSASMRPNNEDQVNKKLDSVIIHSKNDNQSYEKTSLRRSSCVRKQRVILDL